MGNEEPFRVFLSSTNEDLKSFRDAAVLSIRRAGWESVEQEVFDIVPEPIKEVCRKQLERCQLVLLLVAFRKGWVPTAAQGGDGVKSMTALEVEAARELKKPILLMLANPKTWPGSLYEKEQADRDWMEAFRVGLNQVAELFDPEPAEGLPNFRGKLDRILAGHKQRLLAERIAVAPAASVDAMFEVALDGIRHGSCIPFLGLGIFGEGLLGRKALISAFANGTAKEEASLATAAQFYQETHSNLRSRLLQRLDEALAAGASKPGSVDVLDMLLKQRSRPKLVVSTTYDDVLESRLAEGKVPHVIVAHVASSFDGRDDGKTVLLRPGAGLPPEILPSDKVTFDPDVGVVLYKPLGSPALNRLLAGDAATADQEIDTVTITESDHLTFLSRLRNQSTRFPTAFSRWFQTSCLLFLGYTLDVWQYRLVAEVFRIAGAQGRGVSSQAVRQPQTKFERTSWQRLGADLIELAPQDFARRVIEALP